MQNDLKVLLYGSGFFIVRWNHAAPQDNDPEIIAERNENLEMFVYLCLYIHA